MSSKTNLKTNPNSNKVQRAILDYICSQTCTRAEGEVTKGGIYVTTMGLNYLVYEETKRSNLAKEGENYRSNTAKESENFRSNVVGEVEVQRHNRQTENLGWGSLSEQERSNRAREGELNRSNVARESENYRSNTTNEGLKSRDLEEKQYQFDVGSLSEPSQAVRARGRLGAGAIEQGTDTIFTSIDYVKSFIPFVRSAR